MVETRESIAKIEIPKVESHLKNGKTWRCAFGLLGHQGRLVAAFEGR
jgi:hypothetical protein